MSEKKKKKGCKAMGGTLVSILIGAAGAAVLMLNTINERIKKKKFREELIDEFKTGEEE